MRIKITWKNVRWPFITLLLILLILAVAPRGVMGQGPVVQQDYEIYGDISPDQLAKMGELGVQIEETQVGWARVRTTAETAVKLTALDESWVIVAVAEGAGNQLRIYLPLILNGADEKVGVAGTETYVAGKTYWGQNQYIEYQAGNLPIILGAPHAGYLTPDEIADRTWGTFGGDKGSQEYTRLVAKYLHEATCGYPHMIINKLHRSKIDLNRDKKEGAQGDPLAEQAWEEFHGFIGLAEAQVEKEFGRGHYFDFHTQAHEGQWVEVGHLLSTSVLDLNNAQLAEHINKSSIKQLGQTAAASFGELVRGPTSMGGLLESRGYKSVPSPSNPGPGEQSYFNGGYNISRHGSKKGGTINANQIESYWKLRTDSKIEGYSEALAESILDFFEEHYGLVLRQETCEVADDEGEEEKKDEKEEGGDEAIAGLTMTNDGPAVVGTGIKFEAEVAQGSNIAYAWNFGDGKSSTGSKGSVSHIYKKAGLFEVTVTASNGVSSQSSSTSVFIDDVLPEALFSSSSPDILDTGTNFKDESEGSALSYTWDFGDGQTSTEPNPSHIYAQTGSYTVILNVANALGSSTYTDQVSIEAAPPLPSDVRGEWGLDETAGVGHDRSAYGNNLNTPNGSKTTAGQLYQAAGLSSDAKQFLVIKDEKQNGLDISGSLTLAGWLKPENFGGTSKILAAKYDYGGQNRSYRLDVRSDGQKLGFIVSPNGTFKADYLLTANFAEPLELGRWYYVAGVFDAAQQQLKLYLDGSLVASRQVKYNQIYQSSAPFTLGADFKAGQVVQHFDGELDEWRVYAAALSEGQIEHLMLTASAAIASVHIEQDNTSQVGVSKTFTATPLGGADVTYAWDFGDGQTASGQVVKHTYSNSGTFIVTLNANNAVSSQSATTTVIQDTPPLAAFSSSSPDWLGQLTNFSNTSGGSQLNYLWDFGDGQISSNPTPSHAYATSGDFMVWLTASNSLGASTISQTVTIKPSPPSLWGYWPLDESEGLRHDLSGPGRHLTDPTAVGATAGKFGPALNLTKNSGHYLVQAQNNKAVNSGSLSLVGWVRPERLKDTQVVIARYEYGLKNRGYRLDLRSNEAIGFIVSPDGEFTEDYLLRVSLAEPLQVGQWYHLAAVFDGANQALVVYVDGQEVGRRTVAYPSIYPSTAPLMLGANLEAGSVTQHFEGQLDEWRIFSEALSPTAILDLFEHN